MLARHRLSGYNLNGQVRRKAYLASSALMDSTTRTGRPVMRHRFCELPRDQLG